MDALGRLHDRVSEMQFTDPADKELVLGMIEEMMDEDMSERFAMPGDGIPEGYGELDEDENYEEYLLSIAYEADDEEESFPYPDSWPA